MTFANGLFAGSGNRCCTPQKMQANNRPNGAQAALCAVGYRLSNFEDVLRGLCALPTQGDLDSAAFLILSAP